MTRKLLIGVIAMTMLSWLGCREKPVGTQTPQQKWPDISIHRLWEGTVEVEIKRVGKNFPQHSPSWWQWLNADDYSSPNDYAEAIEAAAERLQRQADKWREEAPAYRAAEKVQDDKLDAAMRLVR